MKIIDHGIFEQYQPELLETDPLKIVGALFCKNEKNQDWYVLQKTIEQGAALVECDTETGQLFGWTGEGGTHDYSTRWPLNRRLLEVRPPESVANFTIQYFYKDGAIREIKQPILSVTSSQAKIALLRAGHLDTIEELITQYPREIQIWFDKALHWERDNVYVRGIAIELDLTEDAVDNLFEVASKL